jgi:hypothetical protein
VSKYSQSVLINSEAGYCATVIFRSKWPNIVKPDPLALLFLCVLLCAICPLKVTISVYKKPGQGSNGPFRTGGYMHAKGEFDVNLKPLDTFAKGRHGINLGRMSIDKTLRGDLVGKSLGEMLSAMTNVKGSAAYVAIEQVSGALHGKNGAFVLQHFGIMDRGKDRLVLEVVPDSGTGELENLSGKMLIIIENGKHYYEFEYTLG